MKNKAVKTIAVLSAVMIASVGFFGCTNTPPLPNPGSEKTLTSEDPSVLTPDEPYVEMATEDDYLAFIDGNAKIKATSNIMFGLKEGSEYSFDEFKAAMDAAYEDSFGPNSKSVTEISYAIIDCGKDGNPEMALLVVADEGEEGSEIQDFYIVKKMNGALCVVDQYESYYRSFGELNKYGVFHSSGSGGASLMAGSYVRVNAAGEHEFIYSQETELAMAEPMIFGYELPSEADLPDGYPQVAEEFGDNVRDKFSFAESSLLFVDESPEYDAYLKQLVYVFHDKDGNLIYPNDPNKKIYDELGILVTDDATIKQMINDRIKELGITEEEMYMLDSTPDSVPAWCIAWDGLEAQPLE